MMTVKQTLQGWKSLGMAAILAFTGFAATTAVPERASAAVQATYYASPTGSGNTCTVSAPCSLTGARDKVRTVNGGMTGDIEIVLRGGTYALSSTFQLTESATVHDSGTNGHDIIYKAYSGETPVLSGGTSVTGWSLYDSGKNIYLANVGTSLQTRQLYVNGVRADRAKGGALPGAVKTATGYTTSDTTMQSWGNKSDIEFVFTVEWTQSRCGVASISGTAIMMKQPCFDIASKKRGMTIGTPTWIENAYELLDTAGEWYLDRTTGYLYYKPLAGQNMSTASIVAPTLEKLVSGTGTVDTPLSHVQFKGIAFQYATYLEPNGDNGFPDIQANFTGIGSDPYASEPDNDKRQPAAVTFTAAHNVRFERNTFTGLGAAGLEFVSGSQSNAIVGNHFYDISGSGIQIGDVGLNDHHPSDARLIVKDNEVSDNYIHAIGAEYAGSVGIFAGYVQGTIISHNEIHDVPYSGISIGWGWGGKDVDLSSFTTPTTSLDNQIRSNLIYDHMQRMRDGGGIYSLSAQRNQMIANNVVHDDRGPYGALYLDNKSRYNTMQNNVLYNNSAAKHMHLNDNYGDITIQYNFWDSSASVDNPSQDRIVYNTNVGSNLTLLPASILNDAGLEPAYRDLHPLTPPSDTAAPSAPAGVTLAARTDRTVSLSWTASTDNTAVTGYEVSAGGLVYGVTSGTSLTVGGLSPGTAYSFTVRARDAASNLSSASTPLSATTLNFSSLNLATGKTATAYYMDGSTATMHSGAGAANAVDGDSSTRAQAYGQYRWQLQVDLGAVQTISRILVNMPTDTYATAFNLQTSTDGSTFTTAKSITGFAGGISDNAIAAVNARYVRVVAVKPDAVGQTGGQMAINELEVYGVNLALNKTTAAYYMDGSTATMHSGAGAANAVDGDASTKAQAYGQYRWQEQVDLGAVKSVSRIVVTMPTDAYATAFNVATSTDGTAFSTVASITGFSGGTSSTSLGAASVRYVRIIAVTPDGPSQTGGQMSISELEVYGSDSGAPGNPGAITVIGGNAQVALSWTAVSGATGYNVKRSTSAGGTYTTVASNVTSTSYTNTGLTNGTTYYYVVSAVNSGGESGNSPESAAAAFVPLTASPAGDLLQLSVANDGSATANRYSYNAFSSKSYTFAAGDYIEYDVLLGSAVTGAGGLDVTNSDGSYFRDISGWRDQAAVSGHPGSDISGYASAGWFHRKLAVPAAMVGKTAASWAVAGEYDTASAGYLAKYDNITVTNGSGTVKSTIFAAAADFNATGVWYAVGATGTVSVTT